jgi:ketosteroid isomerase-like protein
VISRLEDWFDAADYWRIHLDEVTDLGNGTVLVASRNEIRGKGSGVDVEQGIFTIVTLVDGKIATIRDFPDHAEALAAAGISGA